MAKKMLKQIQICDKREEDMRIVVYLPVQHLYDATRLKNSLICT
jgi:hypothetical protein